MKKSLLLTRKKLLAFLLALMVCVGFVPVINPGNVAYADPAVPAAPAATPEVVQAGDRIYIDIPEEELDAVTDVKFVVGTEERDPATTEKYKYIEITNSDAGKEVVGKYTNGEGTPVTTPSFTIRSLGSIKINSTLVPGNDADPNKELALQIILKGDDPAVHLPVGEDLGMFPVNNWGRDVNVKAEGSTELKGIMAGKYKLFIYNNELYHGKAKTADMADYDNSTFDFEVLPNQTTEIELIVEKDAYLETLIIDKKITAETFLKYPDRREEFENESFNFAVKLEANSGVTLPEKFLFVKSGTVPYFGEMPLDAEGKLQFELKHGESVSIREIPVGIKYTITEEPKAGWKNRGPLTFTRECVEPVEFLKGYKYFDYASVSELADSETPPSTPPNVPKEETPKEYPVQFSKRDAAGEELEGATISVTKTGETTPIEKWKSDGTTKTIKLEPGSYVFEEIAAPEGYKIATEIAFTVDKEGNVSSEGVKVTGSDENLIVMVDEALPKEEPKEYPVQFSKRDAAGNELPGATITVTKQGETELMETWISDGKNHTFNLEPGDYVFKETAAPEGYRIATEIKFSVDKEGKVTSGDVVLQGEGKDLIVMVDNYDTTDEPTPPTYPELPNPNEPDSPDRVVIEEDGVPTTYKKVPNPDNPEEFIYVPDEEVPLIAKTGTRDWMNIWLVLVMISSATMVALVLYKRKIYEDKKHDQ